MTTAELTIIDKHPLETVDITTLKRETVEVLKATVAKHTTDPELSYFLTLSQAHGLNPFNKEIWCYKRAKRDEAGNYNYENSDLIVMTGRDGYLKIAKRNPNFKKIASQAVYENDTFTCDPITEHINHRFSSRNRGSIVGAYAVITEKDGTKHFKYVSFSEYKDTFARANSPWSSKPSAMICKCAESVLCKQYGGIAGITAEETMSYDDNRTSSSPQIQEYTSELKDGILEKIKNCKSIKELDEVGKVIQIEMAKLFDNEKQEIIQVGIDKRTELGLIAPVEAADNPELLEKTSLSIGEFTDAGELTQYWEKNKEMLATSISPTNFQTLSDFYSKKQSSLLKAGVKKLK